MAGGSGKQLSAAQLEHLRQIAHLGGQATAARHGGWAAAHAARNLRGTKAPAAARTSVNKALAAAGAGNSPNRTDLSGRVAGTTNGTRSSGNLSPKITTRISARTRTVSGVSAGSKANARIIKAFGLPKGTVLVQKTSSLPGTGDAAPNSKKAIAATKKVAAAAVSAAKKTAAAQTRAVRQHTAAVKAQTRASRTRVTIAKPPVRAAQASITRYLNGLRATRGR